MIVSWFLFPLLVVLLSLGCGLLVDRAAGARLPGVLLVPLGLALIVCLTQVATEWDATAELAMPLVLIAAVAGFALSLARLRPMRIDGIATAAGVAVFALYAAPFVLSGSATFGGYNLLGESSIHFIGMDYLLHHGRSISGLKPSSYEFCLDAFFGHGYPSGSDTALGAVRPLTGQDVAWIYQPFIALLMAMTALALYAVITPVVQSRLLRAGAAFVAAQPALVYAHAMQGSVKELATVWVIALMVALVGWSVAQPATPRRVIPLAVAVAASLGVLNIGIVPWLGLILLAVLALALWGPPRLQWNPRLKQAVVFLAIMAALSFPALLDSRDLFYTANDQLTAQGDLSAARGFGNLVGPLKKLQVVGIWLDGDFRIPPAGSRSHATYFLLGVALLSGLVGLLWSIRRRALIPLLYFTASVIAGAYVYARGSPWADSKALMITSPAVMLMVVLGAAALIQGGARADVKRRLAGFALLGLVALGVVGSNALAYHAVNLAPRARLTALEQVDNHIAGQGPTVYLEFEEHGKHFLRKGDPEGRSEGCQRRFLPMRSGGYPVNGFSSDVDDQTLRYLTYFRTIVLRRSPAISRPPSTYRRTYANDYYEVWQRPPRPPQRVLEHASMNSVGDAAATPGCGVIEKLARRAQRRHARLAYVERPRSAVMIPAQANFPPTWVRSPSEPDVLIPVGPGRVTGAVRVPKAGAYTLWLGGSFGRQVSVRIGGHSVGSVAYRLNGQGQYERIGQVRLNRGRHTIELLRVGGDLHPGNGGTLRSVGPVVLQPQAAQARAVRYIDPADAKKLCGRSFDWIEIVAPVKA